MSMILRQSIGQSLKQAQYMRLSQAQRLAVSIAQLQRRRDLVEAIHGVKFNAKATCPECLYHLTDFEIMKGFRDDPSDYTTGCPKCRHRFLPRLHRSTGGGSIEMAFFCPIQTLDRLQNFVHVQLDVFREKNAEVYNSAVVHFGGLKQAFKKLGLTYAFEADLDWKNQVVPFLGKMPDAVIAELLDASVMAVRALRKERGIKAYSRRKEAENL